MMGLKAELQREPLLKSIDVPGIQSPVWIRKLGARQIVSLAGTVFTSLPRSAKEGEEGGEVDSRELVKSGMLEEILSSYEKLVLLGVVWGPRPEGLADDEVWGDPQEPCLEEGDIVRLDHEQLYAIGNAVIEFAGMTEEARQLAEHFRDENGEAGGDSPSPARSDIWSPTVGTPSGGVLGSGD